MSAWALWLVVAGVLAIAEVLTLTFVLGMLAGGAAAAAIVAALSGPPVVQGLGFIVVSGGLLLTVMPMARRHRHMPPLLRTGTAALVGSRGTAITQVDKHSGLVRLGELERPPVRRQRRHRGRRRSGCLRHRRCHRRHPSRRNLLNGALL
jgi:membrane protein implicated in regulation of membrane protease activity